MAAATTFSAPIDVGLHGLEGVVLADRHLLERGGVDDDVDAARRQPQAVDGRGRRRSSSRNRVVREAPLQLGLLELVAAERANRLDVVFAQDPPHECAFRTSRWRR